MVTPALFERYPDARALAAATPAELEPLIVSTGFFRQKSKALIGMAQRSSPSTAARCRPTWTQLTELPGVGRKTANVVLGHALGVPGLPVDRHVLRVVNRIGIAEGDDPVIVETQLCAALPPSDVDARVGRPDPARPPRLQAQAALRPMLGARRLRLLRRRSSASRASRPRQAQARTARPAATVGRHDSRRRRSDDARASSNASSLKPSR